MSRCEGGRRLGTREAAHARFEEDGLALLGRGGGGHVWSCPRGVGVQRSAEQRGGDPLLL